MSDQLIVNPNKQKLRCLRNNWKIQNKEDKQDEKDHTITVEKMYDENIKDVLKDAQNIKPSESVSRWICGVIDKL